MKRLLIAVILICSIGNLLAQEADLTTFILVRHAEKSTDDREDPNLSEIGFKRADALKNLLVNADITAIYSTSYKRTIQTVTPIADALNLKIESYNPREKDFLIEILNSNKGGTVLISGHSNITPLAVNKLLGIEKFEWLKENEYDKVFVVSSTGLGKSKVAILTY